MQVCLSETAGNLIAGFRQGNLLLRKSFLGIDLNAFECLKNARVGSSPMGIAFSLAAWIYSP